MRHQNVADFLMRQIALPRSALRVSLGEALSDREGGLVARYKFQQQKACTKPDPSKAIMRDQTATALRQRR